MAQSATRRALAALLYYLTVCRARRTPEVRMRTETVLSLALGLAMTMSAPATALAGAPHQPPYQLIDVQTFGGAHAELDGPAMNITRQGAILGTADTTITDSDYPNDGPFGSDPQILHAFSWQDGRLTDLGALPGNNASAVFEINGRGVGAGASETTEADPLTGAPAQHPVEFRDGRAIDLGTLPGGTEGFAVAINDRGQIAGMSNNSIPDPFGLPQFFDWRTEIRSFIWQDGALHDLGTLGGPDTIMATLNARGQIAGDSYTNETPNAPTGVPTLHPYLWTDGHMRDLGTLGGTSSSTTWLNGRGDVVGISNLAGDQTGHPFLWDGRRLRDLGTLGGDFGIAWNISDAEDAVGWSSPPGNNVVHAFLWRHGVMTDLTGATSSQCTAAESVNNLGQVVGSACGDSDALLWSGGRQYDLNTLVGPSDVHLTEAAFISDRGEIAALGVLPNGNQHVFLLRPTGAKLAASITTLSDNHKVSNPLLRPLTMWPHVPEVVRPANCHREGPRVATSRICG